MKRMLICFLAILLAFLVRYGNINLQWQKVAQDCQRVSQWVDGLAGRIAEIGDATINTSPANSSAPPPPLPSSTPPSLPSTSLPSSPPVPSPAPNHPVTPLPEVDETPFQEQEISPPTIREPLIRNKDFNPSQGSSRMITLNLRYRFSGVVQVEACGWRTKATLTGRNLPEGEIVRLPWLTKDLQVKVPQGCASLHFLFDNDDAGVLELDPEEDHLAAEVKFRGGRPIIQAGGKP